VDKRLVTIQPGRPGHPALFIVPGGKGGEREFTIYARVVRKLDPAWPVYGFLARGRDGVEAPHRNVDEMVADYEDTLRNVQPHGPYALVGDCLGGLAAHALACRLRAAGEAIVALVLMDTIFPAPREHRRHLWRRFGARMRSSLKNISAAPVRARLAWTRLEVEELASFAWGVWGPAIANRRPSNARARDWHIHCVFHAYPAALLRYKGSPYPGALDLLVSDDFNRTEIIEPWRRFATGGMRVHAMAGNHETYVRDESDSLGRTLARILAAAVTTH